LTKPFSKRTLDINTLGHLAHRLGFRLSELKEVASQAEKLYTFDKEPKKMVVLGLFRNRTLG
jgi:hypothetical protein